MRLHVPHSLALQAVMATLLGCVAGAWGLLEVHGAAHYGARDHRRWSAELLQWGNELLWRRGVSRITTLVEPEHLLAGSGTPGCRQDEPDQCDQNQITFHVFPKGC